MRTAVLAVIVATGPIIGCDSNTDSSTDDPSKESSVVAASQDKYPRLTWKSVGLDGTEEEASGTPASLSIIEDKFQELDWDSPASNPSLAVELAADTSLTITLSSDATEGRHELIAIWRRLEKEGDINVVVVRHSNPLEDAEQALALLRSFANNDETFEPSVEWTIKTRGLSVPTGIE